MELLFLKTRVNTRKSNKKYLIYYVDVPYEARGRVLKAIRIIDEHRIFYIPELITTRTLTLPKILANHVVNKDIVLIGYLSDNYNYVGTSTRVTSKTYNAIVVATLIESKENLIKVARVSLGDISRLDNEVEIDIFSGLSVINTKGTIIKEGNEIIIDTSFRIGEGKEVLAIIKKPLQTYLRNVKR